MDGKATSAEIKEELKAKVEARITKGKKRPHLAAILVGEHGASLTYVNAKVKACAQVGFESSLVRLSEDISEADLLAEVEKLNENPSIDGFIVQLPLPKHVDEQKVIQAIDPSKDVDGFHPENVGRMALGLPAFLPATPAGILELLKRHDIETEGKHCLVLGRSHIVGSPMSILMARNGYPGNATVTIAHSRTKDLPSLSRQADIIIAAVGRPHFLTVDMVKEGAVIVDVGIHRIADESKKSGFRLIGDVDYEELESKASAMSPVPGGVGPMTIASLLMNTLQAAEQRD